MDILDEMTKEELVHWVRGRVFFMQSPPKMSDILFYRWQVKSEGIRKRREKHLKYGESLNMSKRDEYAQLFNKTSNMEEKMALAKKMEPYEKKFRDYLKESEVIMRADKKVDKLYAQIDIERAKEKEKC